MITFVLTLVFIVCSDAQLRHHIVSGSILPTTSSANNVNDSSISDYMRKNRKILLQFYAPWCHHCVVFQGEAAKIINTFKEQNYNVSYASVDITSNRRLKEQFSIKGIPSLFYIQNGRVWKYGGDLNHDGVVEFLKNLHTHTVLPKWTSPLGPLGIIRGYYGSLISFTFSILPRLTKYLGVSSWTGFFILTAGAAVFVLIVTIVVVLTSFQSERPKNE